MGLVINDTEFGMPIIDNILHNAILNGKKIWGTVSSILKPPIDYEFDDTDYVTSGLILHYNVLNRGNNPNQFKNLVDSGNPGRLKEIEKEQISLTTVNELREFIGHKINSIKVDGPIGAYITVFFKFKDRPYNEANVHMNIVTPWWGYEDQRFYIVAMEGGNYIEGWEQGMYYENELPYSFFEENNIDPTIQDVYMYTDGELNLTVVTKNEIKNGFTSGWTVNSLEMGEGQYIETGLTKETIQDGVTVQFAIQLEDGKWPITSIEEQIKLKIGSPGNSIGYHTDHMSYMSENDKFVYITYRWTDTNSIRLFRNGAFTANFPMGMFGYTPGDINYDDPIYISGNNNFTDFFKGKIKSIRIYNTLLSDNEIYQNYEADRANDEKYDYLNIYASDKCLLHYDILSRGNNPNKWLDISGNNHHGILYKYSYQKEYIINSQQDLDNANLIGKTIDYLKVSEPIKNIVFEFENNYELRFYESGSPVSRLFKNDTPIGGGFSASEFNIDQSIGGGWGQDFTGVLTGINSDFDTTITIKTTLMLDKEISEMWQEGLKIESGIAIDTTVIEKQINWLEGNFTLEWYGKNEPGRLNRLMWALNDMFIFNWSSPGTGASLNFGNDVTYPVPEGFGHMALRWQNGIIRPYYNGIPQGSSWGLSGLSLADTRKVLVGLTSKGFKGEIKALRLYTYGRTDAEILESANADIERYEPKISFDYQGLVASYDASNNNNTNSIFMDSSGNNNHAEILGTIPIKTIQIMKQSGTDYSNDLIGKEFNSVKSISGMGGIVNIQFADDYVLYVNDAINTSYLRKGAFGDILNTPRIGEVNIDELLNLAPNLNPIITGYEIPYAHNSGQADIKVSSIYQDDSMKFDGLTNLLKSPVSQNMMNNPNGVTLEFIGDIGSRVNHKGIAGDHVGGNGSVNSLIFGQFNANNYDFGFYDGKTATNIITIPSSEIPTGYVYIALTYNRLTGILDLIINNEVKGTKNIGKNIRFGDRSFLIGRAYNDVNRYSDMNLKHFNIYNYALTSNELETNYKTAFPKLRTNLTLNAPSPPLYATVSYPFPGKLTDENNNPIANANIRVKIKLEEVISGDPLFDYTPYDYTYNTTTNSNGEYTINHAFWVAGSWSAVAYYDGDDNYLASEGVLW
jgi:hypothetical protein